jgi:hypothetical protein
VQKSLLLAAIQKREITLRLPKRAHRRPLLLRSVYDHDEESAKGAQKSEEKQDTESEVAKSARIPSQWSNRANPHGSINLQKH